MHHEEGDIPRASVQSDIIIKASSAKGQGTFFCESCIAVLGLQLIQQRPEVSIIPSGQLHRPQQPAPGFVNLHP